MVAGPSQPAQPPGGTPFQHEVRAATATAQTQPLDHRPQQVQYQQHINHPQPPLQLQTPQQATAARKREAEKKRKRELEREKAEEEDFNMGKKGWMEIHSRFNFQINPIRWAGWDLARSRVFSQVSCINL